MKNKLSFFSLFTIVLVSSQHSKTTYFDRSWKETTKDNAAFYRIQETTSIDSIIYNRDFYGNGNLQNQWYSLKKNIQEKIGTSFWYNEDGSDEHQTLFYPNWEEKKIKKYKGLELKFYYPNGKLWKTQKLDGFDHADKIYGENGKFISEIFYHKEDISKIKYSDFHETKNLIVRKFWKENNSLAYEKFYDGEKNDANVYKIIYYDKQGNKTAEFGKENIIGGRVFNKPDWEFQYKNDFIAEAIPSKEIITNVKQIIDVNDILFISKNTYCPFFLSKDSEKQFIIYNSYEKRENRVYSVLKEKKSALKNFNNENFLSVSEIKSQKKEDLKDKIKNTAFVKEGINVKYHYYFFTPEILVKQELRFRDDQLHGFGSVEIRDDNNIEKWRVDRASFYKVHILNINQEKPILLANESENLTIIPTEKGFLFNNELLTEIPIETITKEYSGLKRTLSSFDYPNYYLVMEKNGKQILYNKFGKNVFEGDEISFNDKFIVVKNLGKTEIYNHFLKNITPNNTQNAYLYPEFVNVLTKDNVTNINFLGEIYYKPSLQISECGTGRCYSSKNTDHNKENKKLKLVLSSSCGNGTFYSEITFNNIDFENHKIELIDAKNLLENQDDLQYFSDEIENYFIISSNEKFGLYSFNNKQLQSEKEIKKENNEPKELISYRTVINKKTKKKKVIKDIIYFPSPVMPINERDFRTNKYTTDAIELIPIINDKIEFRDGIFINQNQNLYSIYPNPSQYKYVGKRMGSFIEIESLTEKKGWLDLKTNKEYYNK